MGGFLGIGGSSEKTDRGNQLAAEQDIWNQLGFSRPLGQQATQQGLSTLNQAKGTLGSPQAYWQGLLAPGRTQATSNAAPVTNAVQEQADAIRTQEANLGTGRGGGTAGANRESSSQEMKAVDDVINQNLMGGRQAGATGLLNTANAETNVGGQQSRVGSDLLGTGASQISDMLNGDIRSRALSHQIGGDAASGYGNLIGGLIKAGLAF